MTLYLHRRVGFVLAISTGSVRLMRATSQSSDQLTFLVGGSESMDLG
ncbi:hypothetical protein MHJ85_06545 [Brevibacterium ravenspurgense]|nr:hypothetical protein [Brevibacterium ravenspurgense]MCG7300919.1 hypothetical protein [Brevibacterium ravenspurgense]